jgi:transcriptional regulator with XRE-family HTH domain
MSNKKSKASSDINAELAAKIAYLFDTYRNADGERYSYLEVERLTNGGIDNSWLSKLASGKATRPGLEILKTLTNFFGITPDFWFKDLNQWVAEQKEKNNKELRDTIAMRSSDLSPEAQQIIFDLVEAFEKRSKKSKPNEE